jgi:hypothetical protein
MKLAKLIAAVVTVLLMSNFSRAEEFLFHDDFKTNLSERWQIVGLQPTDYRVRDGGLEMRVQPGKLTTKTPMLKVVLPFTSTSTVSASVKVTLLDEFTQDHEFAGVFLIDESGPEFRATKERVDGKMVFAPGVHTFNKPEDEQDPSKSVVRYTPVKDEAGPLRILVDRGEAFFQVGPGAKGKYLSFFHSAIRDKSKERGFCLTAAGAPKTAAHWVRFEDFQVVRQ